MAMAQAITRITTAVNMVLKPLIKVVVASFNVSNCWLVDRMMAIITPANDDHSKALKEFEFPTIVDNLDEKKGILTLNGTAMDNDTVALFMTNLEKAEHINAVDLTSTKLKTLKEANLNVTDFILKCKIYTYKEEPKPETDKKKKKKKKK